MTVNGLGTLFILFNCHLTDELKIHNIHLNTGSVACLSLSLCLSFSLSIARWIANAEFVGQISVVF